MNDAPGLFADADHIPYRQGNKRDLWVYLEKICPAAFLKPSLNYTVQIQDGMLDIVLNLLQSMFKFSQYFQYFWGVKVKPNFSISSVVSKLDKTKNKMVETISIDDKSHTPSHDWSWH